MLSEYLIDEEQEELSRLLDLDDMGIFDETRIKEIQRLLHTYILPFFTKADTLVGIRAMYASGEILDGFVRWQARDLILKES